MQKWLIAGLLIVAFVLAVRFFCVASYRVSTDSMSEVLQKGDYILVDKLKRKDNPGRGRPVLFFSPLQKDKTGPPLFLSRCVGMPGDTLYITDKAYRINGLSFPNLISDDPQVGEVQEEYTLVVPRKNIPYRLNAISLVVCKEAILQEIGDRASFKEGKLYIDGRESSFFIFRQDYYWMLSDNVKESVDSRFLGFIPAERVVGNVWFCWYSNDKKRFFKPVY